MLNPYQRRLLLSYIANAAGQLGRRHPVAFELATWVVENGRLLDFEPGKGAPRRRRRWESVDDEPRLTRKVWADFRNSLRAGIRAAGNPKPDLTARRLGRLAALWLAAPGTGPTGGRLAVAVVNAPAGTPR